MSVEAVRLRSPDPGRLERLIDSVETVFHGKRDVVRFAVAALLARGHVLFEDIPGDGKTTLARSLAGALGLSFRHTAKYECHGKGEGGGSPHFATPSDWRWSLLLSALVRSPTHRTVPGLRE